jgi:hypothetical protein
LIAQHTLVQGSMEPLLHNFARGCGEQCLASMSTANTSERAWHWSEGVAPIIGCECSEGLGHSIDELLAGRKIFVLRNNPGHAGYWGKASFVPVAKFFIKECHRVACCSHGN